MKLALHRSITFWSGIFVMAFIVWAWRDSRGFYSGVALRKFTALHEGNGITIWTTGDRHAWFRGRSQSRFITRGSWCAPPLFIRREDAVHEVFGERGPQSMGLDLDDISARKLEAYAQDIKTRREYLIFRTVMSYHGPWQVFVPHWLLLPGFALPWSGLLVWRARRRRPPILDSPA